MRPADRQPVCRSKRRCLAHEPEKRRPVCPHRIQPLLDRARPLRAEALPSAMTSRRISRCPPEGCALRQIQAASTFRAGMVCGLHSRAEPEGDDPTQLCRARCAASAARARASAPTRPPSSQPDERQESEAMHSIQQYLSSPAFDLPADLLPKTPWNRPFRRQDLGSVDLLGPLAARELSTNRSLAIHRILLNIYEQSMLFLPQRRFESHDLPSFRAFYDPDNVALGQSNRVALERAAFSFLDDHEIKVTGRWEWEHLEQYFLGVIERYEEEPCSLTARIDALDSPTTAYRYLLIQQASDFLSEASAMGRAMLGSFGATQSELMKVFIDEYGYGVHDRKHSTLFERCCSSVGLDPEPHRYYFHYLPSSIALTNYFHHVCSNKHLWFRYLGALYYTEASIPHFNKALSRALRKAFEGAGVDTRYFDEHVHIDQHHRRMVLDDVIRPTIALCGAQVIPEMVIGFESFRLLQSLADRDCLEQLAFVEDLERSRKGGFKVARRAYEAVDAPLAFSEPKGEISYSHIHDHDELFTVELGSMEFFAGITPVVLEAGDSIIIPAGRLHGSRVINEPCTYRVQKVRRR
ncbi:Cupin domain hypothetical protein [Sorangium cellulosum So ce56]|uniref:Cupin type-2 domain-containing protein n=2 Tax=Sorangium cellulosum TaxID=56 RepID=A9FS23_SORC5|nr:Cupin domain hypothetical protein [Sorangium cellulosum So ce56]